MTTADERKAKIKELAEGSKYTISLYKDKVELDRKNVPIEYLSLDPKNQRIQFLMTSKGFNLSDEEIHAQMWKLDYVKQLANSILHNGGLLCPLIVKADGTVAEGNSRLVALRELRKRCDKEGIAPPTDVLAPICEVLPENFDDNRLIWLLGEWHIAGKHEWDPYEQAEFIYKMWKEEGRTYDNLVNQLRMSKSTIRQKINAYELMVEYLRKYRNPEEIYKWSYFEELFKKKDLRERLDQEPDFKTDFFELVAKGGKPKEGGKAKFEGADVRKLPEVIADKEAWDLLKTTKDFNAAYAIVISKKGESNLRASLNSCINSLDTVEVKEIFDLQVSLKEDQDHPTAKSVRELYKKLIDFSKLVGVELEE